MTPRAALEELLARLAGSGGTAIYVSNNELATWPAEFVAELKTKQLLVRASPATSAICPGCERECAMPVEVLPDDGYSAAAFIICDKRSDINRVSVPIALLAQWRTSGLLLAECLARLLSESRPMGADAGSRWAICQLVGKKHKDRLALTMDELGMTLSIAGHTVDLSNFLSIKRQTLWMDKPALLRLVDQPTGKVAAQAESADERRERLLDLVESERSRNPRRFLKAAAEREGITVYALKQVIYRKPPPANPMTGIAATLTRPVSTKARPKR